MTVLETWLMMIDSHRAYGMPEVKCVKGITNVLVHYKNYKSIGLNWDASWSNTVEM